jgi:hypothetical protein
VVVLEAVHGVPVDLRRGVGIEDATKDRSVDGVPRSQARLVLLALIRVHGVLRLAPVV